MEVIALGLSHKTAPVEIRERLHFPEKGLSKPLELLAQAEEILECLLLSTCNRVEIYAVAEEVERAFSYLTDFLSKYHQVPPELFQGCIYTLQGEAAIRHIFRVASSLDSLVVGESQILGQVKMAYTAALEQETTGVILNHLLERALSVAKRVRTETAIAEAPVSVSSAAVELAKKIFGDLSGRTVLIIGAGEMSELAAKHLVSDGVRTVLVSNRNYQRAVELAERFQGRAVRFEDAKEELLHADIVISSTGAPHFILHRTEVQDLIRKRRNRPLFIIDIAVPRDIDPEVNQIDNVYLYDIDDLEAVAAANKREREREAERAEAIIDKEVLAFSFWLRSLDVVPTIVSLRKKVEEIRQGELERHNSKLASLSPEQREVVSALTTAIVNKILHYPLTELKRCATLKNGHFYVEALRRLFKLEEKDQ